MTQQKRETGDLTPLSTARTDNQRAYNDKDEKTIRKLIQKKPDATLAEVAAAIGKRVNELAETAGCRVLRLPPYSPDYNPIEMAISKVKTVLRKLAKRTVPGLFAGITKALATVALRDARAYIEHCGYAT